MSKRLIVAAYSSQNGLIFSTVVQGDQCQVLRGAGGSLREEGGGRPLQERSAAAVNVWEGGCDDKICFVDWFHGLFLTRAIS